MLELNQSANALMKKMGLYAALGIRDFRYTLLAVSMVLASFFAFPVLSVFDPPHVLGRELMYLFTHQQLSLSGAGLLLGILLFETFSTSRAWCNYLCPSGGGLAIAGARRLLHINMDGKACVNCDKCDEVCPYYLKPMGLASGKGFDWDKCDNCGLCRDVCPVRAINYSFDMKRW